MALSGCIFFAANKNLCLSTTCISQYAMFSLQCFEKVSLHSEYSPQPLRHPWTSMGANTDSEFIVFLTGCGAKSGTRALWSHTCIFLFPRLKKKKNSKLFRSLLRVFLEFKVIFSWVYLKSNLRDLTSSCKENFWIGFSGVGKSTSNPIKIFWLRNRT